MIDTLKKQDFLFKIVEGSRINVEEKPLKKQGKRCYELRVPFTLNKYEEIMLENVHPSESIGHRVYELAVYQTALILEWMAKIIPGEDRQSTSEFMPIMANRMVDLIPRFKNLNIRRLWRGLYPMTPDGVAVVGKPANVEGLYLGIGMCGQGFMMGPGVGLNITNLITKGKPIIDEKIFNLLSPDRNFYSGKKEALK